MDTCVAKVLAVKFPTAIDRNRISYTHLQKVYDISDVKTIKSLLEDLLFDGGYFRYDYCLVYHGNKYYVIDPVDHIKRIYSRKEIFYHPLFNLLTK
jgi:hypothetical protein